MQRADQRNVSNWLQWRNDTPNKYLRSFRFNLNQWAGWNYGGDLLNSRRQRQRARRVPEQLGHRHGRQRQRADVRRPRHARRAGRLPQPAAQHVGLSVERRAPPRRPPASTSSAPTTASAPRSATSAPNVTWRPVLVPVVSGGLSFSTNHDQSQWIEERRRPLRVRPHRSAHRRPDHARELHPHAAAVDPDLRAAVRVGRRLLTTSRSWPTAAPLVRGSLPAVRLHRQSRLQLPLVPHHQRAALGVPARLDAVRRLAAGPRRTRSTPARSTSAATSAACSTRPARNVFLVKWAYWLNY